MTDKEIYESMVELITEKIPDFEIKYKDENFWSKVRGILVYPFNQQYMTHYTTTLYPVVYFPSRAWVEADYRRAWKVLAHEFVHLWDRKCMGVLFDLAYALPQVGFVLALPALLAIWFSPWFLWFLTALLCLLPIPSYGRMVLEARGYTMSMAVNYWRHGRVSERTRIWIAQQFTGAGYYFMWPFEHNMAVRLDNAVYQLEKGTVFDWPDAGPYRWVHQLITQKD